MRPQPLRIWLVQQGVWAMSRESMPLASGYLKATALADPVIAAGTEMEIHNFDGGATLFGMANVLFHDGAPDVLAFSVLGWNYREFTALAETFKQLNPAWESVLGWSLGVAAVLTWFAALVTGSAPWGLRNLSAYALRYAAQLNAYLYLLTDAYPHASPLEGDGTPVE